MFWKSLDSAIHVLRHRVSHNFCLSPIADRSRGVRFMISAGLSLGLLRGANRAYNHFCTVVPVYRDGNEPNTYFALIVLIWAPKHETKTLLSCPLFVSCSRMNHCYPNFNNGGLLSSNDLPLCTMQMFRSQSITQVTLHYFQIGPKLRDF